MIDSMIKGKCTFFISLLSLEAVAKGWCLEWVQKIFYLSARLALCLLWTFPFVDNRFAFSLRESFNLSLWGTDWCFELCVTWEIVLVLILRWTFSPFVWDRLCLKWLFGRIRLPLIDSLWLNRSLRLITGR